MGLPRFAVALVALLLPGLDAEARDTKKAPAPPSVVSIERLLLPDAIADRIQGSGIECRELAVQGARHKMHLAILRLVLSEKVAIRGGVGMARISPQAIPVADDGLAAAGGVAYTVWNHGGYAVEVDLAAAHGRYSDGALTDATLMVAFRGRP
jgi:hypothetical protein